MKILCFAEVSLRQRVGWKPVLFARCAWPRAAQLHRVGGRISITNREQTTRLNVSNRSRWLVNLLCNSRAWGNAYVWKGETLVVLLEQQFLSVPSVEEDADQNVFELGGGAHFVSGHRTKSRWPLVGSREDDSVSRVRQEFLQVRWPRLSRQLRMSRLS